MHIISNERALAHWRALNGLPPLTFMRLHNNFLREQPGLAGILLTLLDVPLTGPEGKETLPDASDPKMISFALVTDAAAVFSELLCREAGRPLRQLTIEEAHETAETAIKLFDQMDGADKAAGLPKLATTSAQPHLLAGAIKAHFIGRNPTAERVFREVLGLRVAIDSLHQACGDEPPGTPRSWTAERIEFALSAQGDPLRREALSAGENFRVELAAQCLAELERCVADPKATAAGDVSFLMHSLYLLAQWREASAWPAFRKLFSLPGDIAYDLLGDVITEGGSFLLAMVGGQHQDELRAMIEDEALDEYCRGACLEALTCLVAWGELPRAELVAYLRGLLTAKLRGVPANEHVLANVVSAACDLEAWELRPEIEAAYARGVVDEGFIDLEFFLDAQAGKAGQQWPAFCEDHPPVTDVAGLTEWLDEPFEENSPLPGPVAPEVPLPPSLDDRFIEVPQPFIAPPKIGRNELCPCGSGKKYKKCCGK